MILGRIASKAWKLFMPSVITEWLIIKLCQLSRINLLDLAHSKLGLLNYENLNKSGEATFIHNILPRVIHKSSAVLIDAGAHYGEYSLQLRKSFPEAAIYALDPNPASYKSLEQNLTGKNINCLNLGLDNKNSTAKLFTYSQNESASHASLYSDAFKYIHNSSEITSYECKFVKLDDLTASLNIETIDFIKIDAEGAEFKILEGAEKLIKDGNIHCIQFEFNEMNIISRVFLKDFYKLLDNYLFFRITPTGLLPLNHYRPENEIFRFQNIVCILKNLEYIQTYVS